MMNLTRGDIGNLISALDEAVEANEILMRSNLPPKGCRLSKQDRENEAQWSENIKIYRKLRRKLARAENSWERGEMESSNDLREKRGSPPPPPPDRIVRKP